MLILLPQLGDLRRGHLFLCISGLLDVNDDDDDGAMTEWYRPSEIPISQLTDQILLT